MTDKEIIKTDKSKEDVTRDSRRTFLKKAGVFALYTPPAVTMLMQPSQASMMKSPGGAHQGHKRRGGRHDGGHRSGGRHHGGRHGGNRGGRHN